MDDFNESSTAESSLFFSGDEESEEKNSIEIISSESVSSFSSEESSMDPATTEPQSSESVTSEELTSESSVTEEFTSQTITEEQTSESISINNQKHITFLNDHDEIIKETDIDNSLSASDFPESLSKKGYTFSGWTDGENNFYQEGSSAENDLVLKPCFLLNIVFMGDSITAGCGWNCQSFDYPDNYWSFDEYQHRENNEGISGGYARVFAENHPDCFVYNYGIGGASESLEVLDNNMMQEYEKVLNGLGKDNAGLYVIAASYNDTDHYTPYAYYETTLDKSIEGFDTLISSVISDNPNADIVLLTNPDGRYYTATSGDAADIDAGIQGIAEKYSVPFLSLRTGGGLSDSGLERADLFDDGIHPTENTYRTIVYPIVDKFISDHYDFIYQ